ncbi:MAG TPA: hypothetical protein VHN15_12900 [Thermoanaerobaculia bacterium]|nr:hypothetical protein [Thermoanaerobaculia bacterium]
MKSLKAASIVAFALLSLTAPQSAAAQSASGAYRFIMDDEMVKTLEFDAQGDARGSASGRILLADEAQFADGADPDDPRAAGDAIPFFMQASVNGMKVEKNRAVIDAVVRESSHKSYVGRFVQLVVEDNSANLRVPDRILWSFCQGNNVGWIPSDAELKEDDGAFLSWWATDAEREDDRGIPSPNLLGDKVTSCPVFQPFFYDLVTPVKWDGDILVRS